MSKLKGLLESLGKSEARILMLGLDAAGEFDYERPYPTIFGEEH